MENKFEKVSKYIDDDIKLPIRKTKYSAGYDFFVAEDTLIPPYDYLSDEMIITSAIDTNDDLDEPHTLKEAEQLIKQAHAKVTLVPTGIKCSLKSDSYLQLSLRSSCSLKHWLILGNGVGIIDADYYNNETNEGEIFFQIINLSPIPILLKKGDAIGQGIILQYQTIVDDIPTDQVRIGGFGSTDA